MSLFVQILVTTVSRQYLEGVLVWGEDMFRHVVVLMATGTTRLVSLGLFFQVLFVQFRIRSILRGLLSVLKINL